MKRQDSGKDEDTMKEAMFYEKRADGRVRCNLCPHFCVVGEGRKGACAVRENHGGILYTTVYATAVAYNIDPIEKKPIFHLRPGTRSFSLATVGCNFRCKFCQNWEISQVSKGHGGLVIGDSLMPEDLIQLAVEAQCATIAYTYTEPTIFFEYAYDTAKMAHEHNIKNIFVTNGYITPEAIETIAPYLDAANVDLKAFKDETYKRVMGGRLQPVLEAIRLYKKLGVWVEVTTLVIPGMNDSDEELREIAEFVVSVGADVPWHISRFHPDYEMLDRSATPSERLRTAVRIGKEVGLKYVYTGNIPGDPYESTYCPVCQTRLVHRYGFSVVENRITDGKCPVCGTSIDGVEMNVDEHIVIH